jgi:hypothetical protein
MGPRRRGHIRLLLPCKWADAMAAVRTAAAVSFLEVVRIQANREALLHDLIDLTPCFFVIKVVHFCVVVVCQVAIQTPGRAPRHVSRSGFQAYSSHLFGA